MILIKEQIEEIVAEVLNYFPKITGIDALFIPIYVVTRY